MYIKILIIKLLLHKNVSNFMKTLSFPNLNVSTVERSGMFLQMIMFCAKTHVLQMTQFSFSK